MVPYGDDPEVEFKAAAQRWLTHLAYADWVAALSMIDEPSSYGTTWTKEAILGVLAESFPPTSLFAQRCGPPQFTDPATARGDSHFNIGEALDGSFWLDCNVPLNGEFSDLTVQFEFFPREQGYSMILHDLHVL